MKKLFLLAWLMMLSIMAVAQNEQVGNDLVIKNGAGTVVERVSATENTEMKFDAKGNKLSIKQDGVTKDISLDEVKTIKSFPAFKLVAQNKNVSTSTLPITLRFKLTGNDHGEMMPVSGESIRFTASNGELASAVTTDDDGVATVEYTPVQSLWAPGFSDVITAIYTFTDGQGLVSRYTAKAFVEYNGDYAIECLSPDQNLGPDEEAEAEFVVYEVSASGKKPYAGATIEFSSYGGWITTQSAVTDANGRVRVKFHNYGDDAKEYPVTVRFWIRNVNGGLHTGTARAKFITLNYKLEALYPKLAVRNDGSEQVCIFRLYEYHNGEWQLCQKEVEVKFEATNITLSNTSDMNNLGFTTANFTAGKSFNQGSVTAKCDIPLKDGKMWQGVAMTELELDDYLFFRSIPVDDPADIYPEESKDVVFSLVKIVNGQPQPCQGMEVTFRCPDGGTISNTLVKTDAEGKASTSFQLNKDKDYATVFVSCSFVDEHGIWHSYAEDVSFELIPYRLEPVRKKVAVRNDGSEQNCYFKLYKYENGQWAESTDGEVKSKVTGVTLTQLAYDDDGITVTFNAWQDFNGGSVTATCDIQLDNGRHWQGIATVELVPDNYLFSRELPAEQISYISPDESNTVVFSLKKLVNGQYQPFQGMEVRFSCESGSLSSTLVETDAQGNATTTFKIDNDKNYAYVFAYCSFLDEQGIWHDYSLSDIFNLIPYKLKCLTPEEVMSRGEGDGSATIRFELLEYKKGEWVACSGKKLFFSATNGTADPDYAITNENGICQTEFLPSVNATEGTVTGSTEEIVIQFDDETYIKWSDRKTAHITITDGGGGGEGPGGGGEDIQDEGLKKADELKDNTYVVDDKTITVDDIREGDDIHDYIYQGEKKDNGVTKVIFIEFEKGDPVNYTTGGGTIHVTPDQLDKEIDMLNDQTGMTWMNLFSLKDPSKPHDAENNPAVSYSTSNDEAKAMLAKATCKMTKNADGSLTCLAYFKSKDGKEAYCKFKAVAKAPWSD